MDETKRCPYCGEEILAVAKKCKHCGEWLEAKELEKEKKACPICGEMVDADQATCPFCNEQTYFEDKKIIHIKNKKVEELNDGSFLYCRSCEAKIRADVSICPNCGDVDPFYFEDIKKKKLYRKIGYGVVTFLAILLMIMFDIKRSFPIAVVIFALSALAKEFIENYINDCQKDMNTIFEKKMIFML